MLREVRNLATLVQTSPVRLLPYSSFAQAGYFLLGIVGIGKSVLAFQTMVMFAAAYSAMNIGAFAVVARVGRNLTLYFDSGSICSVFSELT